jgi:putative glutamine amidotransferase
MEDDGPMTFVAITTSLVPASEKGPERAQLNAAYLHALQAAGGVPIMVPPQIQPAQLNEILGAVRAVLLTGGGDIEPWRYGDTEVHPEVHGVSPQRDSLEVEVTLRALEQKLPMLAICRGMQVLNVALGGSLHQHLPDSHGERVNHTQTQRGAGRDEATHAIEVTTGSLLAGVIGAGRRMVNSMHHQGLKTVAPGLVVTAVAEDGGVEAVEGPSLGAFVLGVQWHPEELVRHSAEARALFAALIAAAGRG